MLIWACDVPLVHEEPASIHPSERNDSPFYNIYQLAMDPQLGLGTQEAPLSTMLEFLIGLILCRSCEDTIVSESVCATAMLHMYRRQHFMASLPNFLLLHSFQTLSDVS